MMFAPMGPVHDGVISDDAACAAGHDFCFNAGHGIGALFPALVGFLSTRLGLGTANAAFSLSACGIMIVALALLPETRGRPLPRFEMAHSLRMDTRRHVTLAEQPSPSLNSRHSL